MRLKMITISVSNSLDLIRKGQLELKLDGGRGFVRFVHLFRNCVPSLKKSLGMSRNSWIWSDMVAIVKLVFGRVVKLGAQLHGRI
jgi:hypothetical protein